MQQPSAALPDLHDLPGGRKIASFPLASVMHPNAGVIMMDVKTNEVRRFIFKESPFLWTDKPGSPPDFAELWTLAEVVGDDAGEFTQAADYLRRVTPAHPDLRGIHKDVQALDRARAGFLDHEMGADDIGALAATLMAAENISFAAACDLLVKRECTARDLEKQAKDLRASYSVRR